MKAKTVFRDFFYLMLLLGIISGAAIAGPIIGGGGGGGVPSSIPVLTSTASTDLSAETDLGALTTGLLYGTVAAGISTVSSVALGSGVADWLTTPSSANLDTAVTDDTGSGLLVFNSSPTLAAPALSGATPYFSMRDTNASVTTRDLFTFTGNATDTGDGTEDFDVAIAAMVAGTPVTFINFDADGNLSLGYNGQTTVTEHLTVQDGTFAVGAAGTVPAAVSFHDAGVATFYDDGNNTSVAVGPVADGTTELGVTGSINASGGFVGALTGTASGNVPLSTVTTAGDLIVGTGSGAVTRLGKGANNTILSVSSAGVLDYHTAISFDDSAAQIYDSAAPTKLLQIECGAITAGNTRVINAADGDTTLTAGTMMPTSSALDLATSGTITGRTLIVTLTIASGVQDGGDDQTILTDSGESFTTSQFVGMTLYNITDGSSGLVTANNGTTITATLAGGTGNDWDDGDVWQVGPGPSQSGGAFLVTAASTIRHPATAGYIAFYISNGTAAVIIDMASDSMVFRGTLDAAVVTLDAGDSIDSSGSTTDDYIGIMNASTTSCRGLGKRGTWVDGGAS